jgi:hypothetical protein
MGTVALLSIATTLLLARPLRRSAPERGAVRRRSNVA